MSHLRKWSPVPQSAMRNDTSLKAGVEIGHFVSLEAWPAIGSDGSPQVAGGKAKLTVQPARWHRRILHSLKALAALQDKLRDSHSTREPEHWVITVPMIWQICASVYKENCQEGVSKDHFMDTQASKWD